LVTKAEKKGKQVGKFITEMADFFAHKASLRFLEAVENEILVARYFKTKNPPNKRIEPTSGNPARLKANL